MIACARRCRFMAADTIRAKRHKQWGFAKLTPEEEIWQRCLSPEVYAPAIKCPVLLLNASNDFHGWFDFGPQVLAKVQGETRAAWTPNANHHIAQEQGVDLPAWMDWQLRGGPAVPRSPKVSIDLDAEGFPQCHVVGDEQDVARIDVFYAMGDHAPPNRFWRKVEAVRKDGEWQAAIPVVNVSQPVHAFANAYYKRPVCVSSTAVCTVVPGQLGAARAELRWSDRLTIPGGWRYLGATPIPAWSAQYLKPPAADDPGALQPNEAVFDGKIPLNAATNFLADPQFAPRAGDDLSFPYRWQVEVWSDGRARVAEIDAGGAHLSLCIETGRGGKVERKNSTCRYDSFRPMTGRHQPIGTASIHCNLMEPPSRPLRLENLPGTRRWATRPKNLTMRGWWLKMDGRSWLFDCHSILLACEARDVAEYCPWLSDPGFGRERCGAATRGVG